MKTLKDTLAIMFRASRYSLAFCLRNAKGLSAMRLALALLTSILSYLAIQANGLVINAGQREIHLFDRSVKHDFTWFLHSGLVSPLLYLLAVLLITRVLGNYNWFFRNRWSQLLRYANRRELQEHRATLDVAMVRSKTYDDINRRIEELPGGFGTRISFSEEMLNLMMIISSFIIFGTSLIWFNPVYAIIIFVTSLPMIVVEFRLNTMWWNLFQVLIPEHKRRWVLERPYNSSLPFVQALMFNQLPHLRKQIDTSTSSIVSAYEQIRKQVVKSHLFSDTMTILGLMIVIADASWSVVTSAGGLGTLSIIIGAARTFQGNLGQIVSLISEQWNSVRGIILIEEEFFRLKSLIQTEYPVIPPSDITPELVFDHVSFTYPNTEKVVIDDVSFKLPSGSKTAIVGASGNGKSTLQALMLRHYDPTSGNIFANNINLKNIRPADWSKVASALTQNYVISERLVGEEIASSRMNDPISIEALTASARFASFDNVIESDPKGFDSQIGTEFGGREFSGGEKQRLALARAHYRGTPILILDEPDASLDPESAEKVINNIFNLKGVTVVMITHHVSRAERCDNVIVMGKGKIVEQGNHSELMALNGIYVSMRNKDRERLGGSSPSS